MSVLRTPPIDLTWYERLSQTQDGSIQNPALFPSPAPGTLAPKTVAAEFPTSTHEAAAAAAVCEGTPTANLTDSAFAAVEPSAPRHDAPSLGSRLSALDDHTAKQDEPIAPFELHARSIGISNVEPSVAGAFGGQASTAGTPAIHGTAWHDELRSELAQASESPPDSAVPGHADGADPWPSVLAARRRDHWNGDVAPMEPPGPVGVGQETLAVSGPASPLTETCPAATFAESARERPQHQTVLPHFEAGLAFASSRGSAAYLAPEMAEPRFGTAKRGPRSRARRSLVMAAGVVVSGLAVASLASLGDILTASGTATADDVGRQETTDARVAIIPLEPRAAEPDVAATGLRPVAHVVETRGPAVPEPDRFSAASPGTAAAPATAPSVVQAARAVRIASLDPQVPVPYRIAAAEPAAREPAAGLVLGASPGRPVPTRPKLVLDMSVPAEEAVRVPFPIRVDGTDASASAGRLIIRGWLR